MNALGHTLFAMLLLWALAPRAVGQVVFSEIHYHPVEEPAFNADGTPFLDLTEDVHEFVEIQNAGAVTVDLGGWTLSGGIRFTFPTNTLVASGAYCVVARNPVRLATVYGLSPAAVLGPYTNLLGNGGDTLRLRDASGATSDAVTYDSRFPWAQSADALGAQDRFTGLSSTNYQYKGRSLQRVSVGWPSSDPANWLASPLSGPTPGAPQSITRTVPKPIVVGQAVSQTTDGAVVVRAGNAVTVNAVFSGTNTLDTVTLEYFVDDVNSTSEVRTAVPMVSLGGGRYTASIPGQVDRSVVRYRFKADRGDGLEVVSPRADDPQIAPVGAGGVREAWHGYVVTPVRTSTNPIYDVLVSSAALTTMNANITQSPKRATAASATGLPRSLPYVAATAPQWDGTQAAVLGCNGELWDIQIRYHGSMYHRAAANNSFKLHFPEHHPLNSQSSWFVTGHGTEFIEAQKINRLLGLPASRMRTVDWYYNSNAKITRSEQGEYAKEMLDGYHELQQQLNPGAAKEETGELYKDVGHRQNEQEGPYADGNESPLAANAGWSQLDRYAWTFSIQTHAWKGPKPVRDLIEGMWTARGDSPAAPTFSSDSNKLASARAWFTNNWDMETTLTSMALLQWMSIWDDAKQNHFFWRRANGKWSRLGWDYDQVMSSGGGGMGGGSSQTLYGGEYGAPTVFDGVNWWKDTFYKCFRTEYQQRLWELNNSFFDPLNLSAEGFTTATTFANSRRSYINTQLAALGTYYKPARPTNAAPAAATAMYGAASLVTSAYAHPQNAAHASTLWEIRTTSGTYEEPVFRLRSSLDLTTLPVPYDQLTYGQTYSWRATHIDTNGHPSVVSAETTFTWGPASATAGTLVLNEILAINRNTLQNGTAFPDYVELRNNGSTALELSGYTLSDDPLVPAKFVFPAGTSIAAAGYLVVWCDDRTNSAGLHAGFGLDGDGAEVLLLRGSNLVDSVQFGPQAPDISIGRILNGTGGWQANAPTPGTANSARTLGDPANLRFNEWMADPAYGDDWVELYNADTNVIALAGLYLSDTPASPTNTRVPALSFIAGNGHTRFWVDSKKSGRNHCDFQLSKNGESLVLTSTNGVTPLDMVILAAQPFDVSQGLLPDGSHTIVSFTNRTASPGYPNWAPAAVRINEVLAHSFSPYEDAVELHNPTAASVDIGGWWLSDDRHAPRKYQFPAGTMIPAGGYKVVYQGSFGAGAVPFAISAWGDEVVLSAVDASGALTGYGALAQFGLSLRNASFGRVDATGMDASSENSDYWLETAKTFGQDLPSSEADFRSGIGGPNAASSIGPVVLNEIQYHPPDEADGSDNTGLEFVELFNLSSSVVNLEGWRVRGGVGYVFPAGTTLAAGAYALLVDFDPATNAAARNAFISHYALAATDNLHGPYSGKLNNDTQNVELTRPAQIDDEDVDLLVDKVAYRDRTPWPESADGEGDSLQRMSANVIGNTAANWAGDLPTPGAPNAGVALELSILTTSPLGGAVRGQAYATTLVAAGGAAPYTWTLASGAVPGLTLSAVGVLSGTPTQAGTYTLNIQVVDGSESSATGQVALTVATSVLEIGTAATLPDGALGEAYALLLHATGGTPPYAWVLQAGAVPSGLTFTAAGALSGTPTTPGTYAFTARVSDNGGLNTVGDFVLNIPAAPLVVTSASPLPQAMLDTAYSQALTAAGGILPYSWTVVSGALPTGLSLGTDGTLSGVPKDFGLFGFTIRLVDGVGTIVTQPFTVVVVPQPLVVSADVLSGGILGDVWSHTFTATGGVPPYVWSLAGGALPAGVSLGVGGTATGTLAAAGSCSFTVQVQDGLLATAAVPFAITIAPSGPLDHYTWDELPVVAYAGVAFPVRLTARDAVERLVAGFAGDVEISANSGGGNLASPVLLTELTDAAEDQFELQNITASAVDVTGWSVILSDSLTDVNILNPSTYLLSGVLPAGGLLRITESPTNTGAGRLYFGSAINWSSSAGTNSKAWIMLFDAGHQLRDFVSVGWTEADLATLSVEANGEAVTSAGQWSGSPVLPGARATGSAASLDSWQRIGTNDSNSAADWVWRHNTNNTDATSFNVSNAGLELPWSEGIAVPLSPTALSLAGGVFEGSLLISNAAVAVTLTASDPDNHFGTSAAFDVLTMAAPYIAGVVIKSGALQLTIEGPASAAFIIESSIDLLHWSAIETLTPAQLPFTWSAVPVEPVRFYRVRTD